MSASIAITPTSSVSYNGAPVTLTVTGTATAFTGSPFTVSGGDATIASQHVTSATAATIVLAVGTKTDTITVTDTISSTTATTVLINVVCGPLPTGRITEPTTNSYQTVIADSGVATFQIGDITNVSKLKVHWVTKGADTTGVLNGSMDGTNWYLLQTLAGGINTVVSVCDRYAQLVLTNGGSSDMTDKIIVNTMSHG